jgi:glycosyltransferase involved in cell wall biosynthesis
MCPETLRDGEIDNFKKRDRRKTVFIVWEPHSPRAKGIAQSLDANVYIMRNRIQKRIHAPIQYVKLFVKTIFILRKERPEVIFCQLPPIFSALAAITYKYFASSMSDIVIDMHTAAFSKPWSYFKRLNKWVMKRSYLIIVTNSELREDIPIEFRAKTMVLEDRIPDIQSPQETKDNNISEVKYAENLERRRRGDQDNLACSSFKIAIISSFSPDEPLEEVLASASAKPEITFYITHDVSRANKEILAKKPDNVILTGFLEYNDYLSLLAKVDAIMVLTTRDKTMLCGAYEAVAFQKPLITSNFGPLKRYFYKGTIYVDNSVDEIQRAIDTVVKRAEEMTKDISCLRRERTKEWNQKFAELESQIYGNRRTITGA